MTDDSLPVLVIGATGFVGGHIVADLASRGRPVRCLVRTPAKAEHLISDTVSVVPGDMLETASVEAAIAGTSGVIVCVQTLSPQASASADDDFMDVEEAGLRAVIAACTAHGVTRVMYVTSIGVAEHGTSTWLRRRWNTEQLLLSSGLDATVVRPGMIVGHGGSGFGVVSQAATKRYAVSIAGPRQRFRTISVDDLAADIVDLMQSPDAVGRVFDVGSDDILTMKQMADVTASSLGRRRGVIVFIPAGLIRRLAPLIERVAHVPSGAISGFVGDSVPEDMIGDPAPLRSVLGRSDRPFAAAIAGEVR